jgi:transcriptional regulator GlxA family with amidase domain
MTVRPAHRPAEKPPLSVGSAMAGVSHRVKPIATKCDTGDRRPLAALVGLDQRDTAILAAARASSAASELISIGDLAEQLRVSVRTVRRWQALGDAPVRLKRSRRLMYRRADIEAWLARLADGGTLSAGFPARYNQKGS